MSTVDSSVSTGIATQWAGTPYTQIASDGTAFVMYMASSSVLKFKAAASPYTSWSSATTIQTLGANYSPASCCIDGSDTIYVAYKKSSGGLYQVTLTKSGSTWLVGTEHAVAASGDFGNAGEGVYVLLDGNSRLWIVAHFWNGSADVWNAYYSTNGGTTWTTSLSGGGLYEINKQTIVAAMIGKYLVVVYGNGGSLEWRRLDTTGTLTSWTAEQSKTATGINADAQFALCADTNGNGVLAVSPPSGSTTYAIRTLIYTASTDTWGSQTDIGTTTSDLSPCVVNANGTVYCFWSERAAANNYAIVYKTWNGSSWSGKTTLIASGSNRLYANAGYGASTVGVSDTLGTANPWTVEFASISLAATLTRTATGAAIALQALGLQRTATAGKIALQALGVTRSATPAALALQALGLQRTATPARMALVQSYTRTATPGRLSLKALGVQRSAPGALALQALGLQRSASPASIALLQTYQRTATPGKLAVQALGLSRTASGAHLSLHALGLTRTATPAHLALQALGLVRIVTPTRLALQQLGLSRTATSAAIALQAPGSTTFTRTATGGVLALRSLGNLRTGSAALALQALGLSRTASGARVAVQALGLAQSATPVHLALQTLGSTRTATPARLSLQVLGSTRSASSHLALHALGLQRSITAVYLAVQMVAIQRTLSNGKFALHASYQRAALAAITLQQFGVLRSVTGARIALTTGLLYSPPTATSTLAREPGATALLKSSPTATSTLRSGVPHASREELFR